MAIAMCSTAIATMKRAARAGVIALREGDAGDAYVDEMMRSA